MAFSQEKTRVPGSVGDIVINIHDFSNQGMQDTIDFTVSVYDTDGVHLVTRSGNLVPHLLASEIQWLQSFVATLRQRANQQLIP